MKYCTMHPYMSVLSRFHFFCRCGTNAKYDHGANILCTLKTWVIKLDFLVPINALQCDVPLNSVNNVDTNLRKPSS